MPILPIGELVQMLGYSMQWSGKKCKLVGRTGDTTELKVRQNCPVLTESQALNLISKLEDVKLRNLEKTVAETNGRVQAAALRLDEGWFHKMVRYMKSGRAKAGVQSIKESYHFQEIPEDSLSGVAVDFHEGTMWELLKKLGCWNRARRKALLEAKEVVIHLFSGQHEKKALWWLKKDGYFVLSVDIQNGLDSQAPDLCDQDGNRMVLMIWSRRRSDWSTRIPGTFAALCFVFLHSAATAGRVLKEQEMREVAFFFEQPADPDEYLDENLNFMVECRPFGQLRCGFGTVRRLSYGWLALINFRWGIPP